MVTYIATVHKDPDSDYGVQFYDFPGCITAGVTLEEAQAMAVEALEGHISVMLEDGDEIPSPSDMETILADPDMNGAVAFMVINIPDDLEAKMANDCQRKELNNASHNSIAFYIE